MDQVLPQLNDMKDILDIKAVEVWDYTFWFWGVLGFLALCLILLLFYLWLKKKYAKKAIVIPLTPIERSRKELQALLEGDLLETGNVRKFYFRLSEIFRSYLEEELQISATEATLEELKPLLKGCPDFTGEELKEIFWFLETSDMAKFAKYVPEKEMIDRSIQSARETMETLARRRLPPQTTGEEVPA